MSLMPGEVVVLNFLGGRVEDDVCLNPVAHSSALGVLTCSVDGIDDGVGEQGVASDGLVVHQPYVDDPAVGMDGVVRVFCVALEHEVSSFLWCLL